MKKILFAPNRRHEIRESFKSLIRPDWQNDNWFDDYEFAKRNETRESYLKKWGYYDYLLQHVYHTFYDDHMLRDEAYVMNQVDGLFYTEEEARRIYEYCNWFYDLTVEIEVEYEDYQVPNQDYFNHPEWPRVISEGKKIVKMMEENEKKYNIDASWDRWS